MPAEPKSAAAAEPRDPASGESPQTESSGRRVPRLFRALRHRNYRLFFSGQFISVTGSWMQSVALGWLLLEITQPESRALWLGIVTATGAVPGLAFSLVAGTVVDRVRKRNLIVATQAGAMVLAFVLAALTHSELMTVWFAVAITFMSGTVNAFDAPARQSFVVEMVGKEDLPQAIALNSAMFNSARMIGPAIAGWAIALVGLAGAFLCNAVSYIAVITGLLLMRLPKRDPGAIREMGSGLKDGLRYIRGNPFILSILVLSSFVSVFAGSYGTLLPLFAREYLGTDVAGFGHLLSMIGLGAILGAITLGSSRGASPAMLLTGAFTMCCALIAASFAHTLAWALVIMPAIGWGMMTTMACTNTLIQIAVPDEVRGRVLSGYTLSFMGMAPLGGLQAGALAQVLGVPIALRIGASISVVAGLWLARWILPGNGGQR